MNNKPEKIDYGFYSKTQNNIAGYCMGKDGNMTSIMITEINSAINEEQALSYFNEKYKMRFPDGKFLGPVLEIKRIVRRGLPLPTIMGKRCQ